MQYFRLEFVKPPAGDGELPARIGLLFFSHSSWYAERQVAGLQMEGWMRAALRPVLKEGFGEHDVTLNHALGHPREYPLLFQFLMGGHKTPVCGHLLTLDEKKALVTNTRLWVPTPMANLALPTCYRVKVTSVKTWKTIPNRVEVRTKFGLYEHPTFGEDDPIFQELSLAVPLGETSCTSVT